MTQSVDFYYDFGSPNAYMAWKALSATGIELELHPVLIGGIFKLTGNMPPWQSAGKVSQKMAYMQLELKRFVKDHALTKFRFNAHFPVNTLLAMRTAIAAQKAGVHDAFYPAVFAAMWEDSQDVSKPDVLAKILDDAGLDGETLVQAASTQDIKDGLMTATQTCVDRGVFGLPAMFVGDDMYFGKDRVWIIEKRLRS